jgi:hypothetical protein
MENNVFLPKKIRVGFQERKDTYSGKLAYVIYYDEKNKIRKATSWENWRDKKIDPQEFDNEPTSGFVLNKKVGGTTWGWNPRQTYTRVYDPRGFEFEITIPNLLYILENCSSIKGKGIEGEFVYGWSGTELLLIPIGAPDYKKHIQFSEGLSNPEKRISSKDLVPGRVYSFAQKGRKGVFLGRFNEYFSSHNISDELNGLVKNKASYFFFDLNAIEYKLCAKNEVRGYSVFGIDIFQSVPRISHCISDDIHERFADMMDLLEKDYRYKPAIKYEVEIVPYEYEELKKFLEISINNTKNYTFLFYYLNKSGKLDYGTIYSPSYYRAQEKDNYILERNRGGRFTSKQIFEKFKPVKLVKKQITQLEKINV